MYEVIIERPRGGAGWGRDWPRLPWQLLARDDDDDRDGGPTKLRMGPRKRTKWLNENLAPLRRFLRSRVGQPWDKVHGEICARIAPRSTVQQHVLQHLDGYVELHPVMIDGWPHHPISYGAHGYQRLANWRDSFYVCPETGILRVACVSRHRARDLK